MEAPEKVYMTPSFGEPDNVLLASFSKNHLNFHRDIEYIRKDSFIKKTIEFIQKHTSEIYSDYQMDKEDWIEDFKKYIGC